ncbi:MAG: DNA replication/repair protein RecF [Candidatus Peregrinibacteria bacterium]
MRLKQLSIKGFRNLNDTSLTFDGKTPLFAFVGSNGQGKTNLLEAIYLCDLSKSFRAHGNTDLVAFDKDFARIEATVEGGEADLLEVIIERSPSRKTLKMNGVVKKVMEFIGNLPTVFFSPDDMAMIHSAPSMRRRYLDILLSQVDREYLETLLSYHQAIRHRNTLLKQIREKRGKPDELDFWDEKIAALGMTLITKRRTMIASLNPIAESHYRGISQSKDELVVGYETSVEPEKFAEKLAALRERDMMNGLTSLGPHRDDLAFSCNGHDMATFASRGEWRSLILSLKFSEVDLLREHLKTEPLLLLDDVFSELDDLRQKYLVSGLKGVQTFVTTTHVEFLEGIDVAKKVYKVENGEVTAL